MNLKETRLKYKMLQKDMADLLGVSKRHYIYWEHGDKPFPASRKELLMYKLKELDEKWITTQEQV